jgi:GNAT superfamily N-acetyltransferase
MEGPVAMTLTPARLGHPDCLALDQELQAYYTSVFGEPDATPTDPGEFAPPHGRFYLAHVDGVAAAMGGWRFLDPSIATLGERPAEIKRMYVAAAWRGRGLARLTLARLESSAHEAGADAVVLETANHLADAVALYRSSGYTDIAPYGHYADAPLAVHLGKWLVPAR